MVKPPSELTLAIKNTFCLRNSLDKLHKVGSCTYTSVFITQLIASILAVLQ